MLSIKSNPIYYTFTQNTSTNMANLPSLEEAGLTGRNPSILVGAVHS